MTAGAGARGWCDESCQVQTGKPVTTGSRTARRHENLLVAAHAMGLGAVWTGVHPKPERVATVREVLGLPEDVVPLNLIPVGYPVDEAPAKDKFDRTLVHWEVWGA